MKLKLMLLDDNKTYIDRLVSAFSVRQDFSVETYSFTDMQEALSTLRKISADFFIASESFDINPEIIPEGCAFAYFSDSVAKREVRGQVAICRYQKAELIYKEILSIYSDLVKSDTSGLTPEGEPKAARSRVLVFLPCSGGVGASSAAAACALRFARRGMRVLYLNLERFGSSSLYFEAEGRMHLGDVLYAIKSKRSNFGMKIKSAIKQDENGVFFIESCRVAPEVMEITAENAEELIYELRALGQFNYIIADIDMTLEGASLAIMKKAEANILVSDGSEASHKKLERIVKAMELISARDEFDFPTPYLMYNRFGSKSSADSNPFDIAFLGGAPKFEGASQSRVIRQLAELSLFDGLAGPEV